MRVWYISNLCHLLKLACFKKTFRNVYMYDSDYTLAILEPIQDSDKNLALQQIDSYFNSMIAFKDLSKHSLLALAIKLSKPYQHRFNAYQQDVIIQNTMTRTTTSISLFALDFPLKSILRILKI